MKKAKIFIALVLMLVAGAAFGQNQKCPHNTKPCPKNADYLEWKGMVLQAKAEARYERTLHRQDTVKTTPVQRPLQQTASQQENRQNKKKEAADGEDLPKGRWRYRAD